MGEQFKEDGYTSIGEYIFVLSPEQDGGAVISTSLLIEFLDKYGLSTCGAFNGYSIFEYMHAMTDEQVNIVINDYIYDEYVDYPDRYLNIGDKTDPRLLAFALKHDHNGWYARARRYTIYGGDYGVKATLLEWMYSIVPSYQRRDPRQNGRIWDMINMLETHRKRHLTLFEMLLEKIKLKRFY